MDGWLAWDGLGMMMLHGWERGVVCVVVMCL